MPFVDREWTLEEINLFRAWWIEGKPYKQLAAAFGISTWTITRLVKRFGLPSRNCRAANTDGRRKANVERANECDDRKWREDCRRVYLYELAIGKTAREVLERSPESRQWVRDTLKYLCEPSPKYNTPPVLVKRKGVYERAKDAPSKVRSEKDQPLPAALRRAGGPSRRAGRQATEYAA